MDAESNSLPASLVLRTPVHSERLQYSGRVFSVIIVQDDNPRLEWTREGSLHVAPFKRIVGAKMSDKASATFDIFWIPESDESDRQGGVKKATWTVPAGHAYAVWLCNAVDCLVKGVSPEIRLPKRQLHAFVNPFSGVAGSSLEIWSQVKNLFSVASIDIVETITTHQGHAEEVCRTLDLNEAKDGIVVVSGDGLFHEVVNGLLHRDDWDEASKIPLGIIPAGSGNGLARSIQTWNPFLAALAIIKGNTEPLDTWSVITNNDRRFAVLSIEWGTVASIDFDSEAVRFMGGARFHLWSFLKLVNRQRYSAELSWLPGEEDPSTAPKLRELQSRMQQEHILRVIEATNNKYTEQEREGETTASSSAIVENNGEPSLSESDLPAVDDEVAPIPSSSNDPDVVEEKVNTTPRGSLITPPESAAEIDLKNIPGPPLRHLVDRASSDEWKTVNGDWMLILGLNTTHMAHNVHAAPRASISDGLIDMLTISKSSRRILLRMIMAMESGQHIQDPDVGYCKAKAFILKPSFKDDKHMLHGIDGEKVICDGLMVEVHPRMLNVFCDTDALAHAALKNPYSLLSKELQKLNTQLIEEMKREVDNMPEDKLSPRAHASPPSSSKINLSEKDSANPSSPKKGA